jgi:hypothetical protein
MGDTAQYLAVEIKPWRIAVGKPPSRPSARALGGGSW